MELYEGRVWKCECVETNRPGNQTFAYKTKSLSVRKLGGFVAFHLCDPLRHRAVLVFEGLLELLAVHPHG